MFEEDVVWEESSCGGLVLVMAVYGARNIPSCSSVVRGGHVVWRCVVGCRVFVGVLRWAWYGVGFVVYGAGVLGMV